MAGSRNKKGQFPTRRAISQQIKQAIANTAEKKVLVGSATTQTTTNVGQVWALTQGIVQGDAVNSRDGTQITIQSYRLKADVFMPTATIAAGVRIIIFTDSQNNGSLPSVTDVLATNSFISQYSIIQQVTNRFHIHHDVTKNLTAGGIQQVVFDLSKSMRHKVSYNGTTDVAASNGKNALFALIITDVGTNFPTYDFTYTIRYLDM